MVLAVGGTSAEAETRPSVPAPLAAASARYDDAATLALIASILSTAQDTMAAIANGFVAEAPSAKSQAEFDAMQAAAVSQIRDTQAAAADALRTIRNGTWSDEVWEAAHAALPVLRASMVAELAVVDALEYPGPTTTTSTVPPLPTTSTTVPPLPTTSTTVPPLPTTSTTVPPLPTTTTTLAPPTTTTATTRVAPTTAATTTTTTTTTTTVPAVVTPQSGGSGTEPPTQRAPDPQLDQSVLGALFAGDAGLENAPATPEADLSGWLASTFDVVLPPMVASVVLSPFVIIEVIAGTVLRSGSSILLPILLLCLSILFLRWRDRSRGAALTTADDEGSQAAAA
jgi:cell pole-organizing protein PopZ